MSDFTDEYVKLLLAQFYELTNAPAEIELYAGRAEDQRDIHLDILGAMDIDTAEDEALDLIGSWVGLSRTLPVEVDGSLLLEDADYRAFLKAKIAANIACGLLVSDDEITLNDILVDWFDGSALALGSQLMKLILLIDISAGSNITEDQAVAIKELDLLPRPVAVAMNYVGIDDTDGTFGFGDGIYTDRGFADYTDAGELGGDFAEYL